MKNKEIERKFLIEADKCPDLGNRTYKDITQGYLNGINDKYIYRLRQVLHYSSNKTMVGEEYFQTIKGSGTKIRDEYEINIMVQQFHVLWPLCQKVFLHKHRYEISENGLIYDLDVYKNELSGLITVEVEFKTEEECDAFVAPDWFGQEVTEDSFYQNYKLAVNGLKRK